MKHPDSDELYEHYRGELPEKRSAKIHAHLELCDMCRSEWESLEAVGEWLATWQDISVSDESIGRVRSTVELLKATSMEHAAVNGQPGKSAGPWLRRAALAAAVVLVTFAFQAFVWNPLKSSVNLGAVFSLSSPAFAQTSDQAVPDTILVITVHTETTLSTPLLDGRYELEELITRLKGIVPEGRYRGILLTGPDEENPVSVQLDDFDPLKETLGIEEIHVGSGVVGVSSFWFKNVPIFGNQGWLIREGEEATRWSIQNFPAEQIRKAWALNFLHNQSIEPYLVWDAPDFRTGFFRSEVAGGSISFKALTEGNGVTATLTEEGELMLSRAVVKPDEIEGALRRLQNTIPDLQLTILVDEETGPEELEKRVELIAKTLGIENVTIKKIKKH